MVQVKALGGCLNVCFHMNIIITHHKSFDFHKVLTFATYPTFDLFFLYCIFFFRSFGDGSSGFRSVVAGNGQPPGEEATLLHRQLGQAGGTKSGELQTNFHPLANQFFVLL